MANKRLNVRHIQKHDTEANWNKAINFIPMKGEMIVYDTDENYNYQRIKIGDGELNVIQLPFIDSDLKSKLDTKADKSNTITSQSTWSSVAGASIQENDAKVLDYLFVPGNNRLDLNKTSKRDIATKPSDYILNGTTTTAQEYGGKFKLSGLKSTSTIELNDSGTSLATVMGLTGWKDTNNGNIPVHELAFAKNGLYRRQGGNITANNTIVDDTFGNWKQIIDSDNIGSYIDKHVKIEKPKLVVTYHGTDNHLYHDVMRKLDPSENITNKLFNIYGYTSAGVPLITGGQGNDPSIENSKVYVKKGSVLTIQFGHDITEIPTELLPTLENAGSFFKLYVNGIEYTIIDDGIKITDTVVFKEDGFLTASVYTYDASWGDGAIINITNGYYEEYYATNPSYYLSNITTLTIPLETYGTYQLVERSYFGNDEDGTGYRGRFSNPIEVTSPIEYYVDTILDFVDPVLNNNSWATISAVARAGLASKVWKVGDWKYLDMTKRDYNVEGQRGIDGGNLSVIITDEDVFLNNVNYKPGTYKVIWTSEPTYSILEGDTILFNNYDDDTVSGFKFSEDLYSMAWGPTVEGTVIVTESEIVSEPTYHVDWTIDYFTADDISDYSSLGIEGIGVSINVPRLLDKIGVYSSSKDRFILIFNSNQSSSGWSITGDYTANNLTSNQINNSFGCDFLIRTTDEVKMHLEDYINKYSHSSWVADFTVTITKTENGRYPVQIIGLDHDNVTDPNSYGRKKAGITFALGRTAAGDDFNKNEPGIYHGILSKDSDIFYYGNTRSPKYWPTSKFREALQTLFDGTEIAPYMVAVDKQNVNKYNNNIKWANMELTSDKVSLPSEYEVWGATYHGYYKEGEQYEFWKDFNSKFRYYGGNAPSCYWLRSSAIPNGGDSLSTPAKDSTYNCFVLTELTFKNDATAVRSYQAGKGDVGRDVAPIFFI